MTAQTIALLCLLLLAGCSRTHRLTVGSKNFTEQLLLGELIAQHLERRLGQPVDRKLNLGGTLVAHQALVRGGLDLYPEYTGTALTAVLKQPPATDPAAVLSTVRQGYAPFHVQWLDPLGFNNTFAMVIPGATARTAHIQTLSDAAQYPPGWRLGVGFEFLSRPDGWPSLQQRYGLKLDGSPRSMDLGLLYRALQQGQVNMVAGNATDGTLAAIDAVVLEDDRHAFPPYQACLVVRDEALTRVPGLREALAELSGRFSDTVMRKLNREVEAKHRSVRTVASDFLEGR